MNNNSKILDRAFSHLQLSHELHSAVPKLKEQATANKSNAFSAACIPKHQASASAIPTPTAEHPSLPSSYRSDLICPLHAPPPNDQRLAIDEAKKQATRPLWVALNKTKAALMDGLGEVRSNLLKNKANREHATNYKRWRDMKPDAPGFTAKEKADIEKAGRAGQLALAMQTGHAGNAMHEQLKNSDMEKFFCPYSGCFRDPSTGLAAGLEQVMQENGEPLLNEQNQPVYTLTLPGTGRGAAWRAQLKTNVQQFIGYGGVPAAHQQAETLVQLIKGKHSYADALSLTGHSLGGGIANYVGIRQNLQATCYNPAALGSACLNAVKSLPDLDQRIEKQSILRIKRDPVSSPKMQPRLVNLLATLTGQKIATPQSLGKLYQATFADLAPEHRNILSAHRQEAFSSLYVQSSA